MCVCCGSVVSVVDECLVTSLFTSLVVWFCLCVCVWSVVCDNLVCFWGCVLCFVCVSLSVRLWSGLLVITSMLRTMLGVVGWSCESMLEAGKTSQVAGLSVV